MTSGQLTLATLYRPWIKTRHFQNIIHQIWWSSKNFIKIHSFAYSGLKKNSACIEKDLIKFFLKAFSWASTLYSTTIFILRSAEVVERWIRDTVLQWENTNWAILQVSAAKSQEELGHCYSHVSLQLCSFSFSSFLPGKIVWEYRTLYNIKHCSNSQ